MLAATSRNRIRATRSTLAILGNLGSFDDKRVRAFLRYAADEWEHVWWIPGAAEFRTDRNEPFWAITDRIRESLPANVQFRERMEVDMPEEGRVVFATSLWTDAPYMGEAPFDPYARIYLRDHEPLTDMRLAEWHWQEREWLRGRICWYKRVKPATNITVLSAAAPSARLARLITPPTLEWVWGGGSPRAIELR